MPNALDIRGVEKTYSGGNHALRGIDLSIREGDFFGFLGPNGAGKTTTIQAITGIGTYDTGTIHVFGLEVSQAYREARKRIGLSPQEFNVDIFATAERIIWYMAGLYGMPLEERRSRVEEMIRVFDLEKHRSKQFRELSGGLKRRVMLARAMVHDPDMLILDEPTAGIDVELRHELWDYLRQINRDGKTILLTSHYLEEVEMLCHNVAIIDDGQVVARKSKEEFTRNGDSLERQYLDIMKKI